MNQQTVDELAGTAVVETAVAVGNPFTSILNEFAQGREQEAAKALGISLRQLQKRLNGRPRATKPRKPAPHFRAALIERSKKSRP